MFYHFISFLSSALPLILPPLSCSATCSPPQTPVLKSQATSLALLAALRIWLCDVYVCQIWHAELHAPYVRVKIRQNENKKAIKMRRQNGKQLYAWDNFSPLTNTNKPFFCLILLHHVWYWTIRGHSQMLHYSTSDLCTYCQYEMWACMSLVQTAALI